MLDALKPQRWRFNCFVLHSSKCLDILVYHLVAEHPSDTIKSTSVHCTDLLHQSSAHYEKKHLRASRYSLLFIVCT